MQAARREDVLNSLSEIVRKLRTRLGESRATVEKHSTLLADATTPSLEALKAYSTGIKVNHILRRVSRQYLFFAARSRSIRNSRSPTRIWGLRTVAESRCCQPRARREPGNCGIASAIGKDFLSTLPTIGRSREIWKRLPNPRVVAADLSSNAEKPSPLDLLGGISTHGTGRFERVIETQEKEIADDPDFVFGYAILHPQYFFLDRFDEADPALQRAAERKLEDATLLLIRYNIAVLKGDQDQMDRTMALATGKRGVEHRWRTRRLSRWRVPAACNRPGSHPAAPSIWPCNRGDARRQRVTRPHERCGKPFAGMLPKRKRTRWRRSRFRMAGMSDTPLALRSGSFGRLLCIATPCR